MLVMRFQHYELTFIWGWTSVLTSFAFQSSKIHF